MAHSPVPRPLTVKAETFIVSKFNGGDPEEIMRAILDQKRSGQLTLHIDQGRIGSIEWREKGAVLRVNEKGILGLPKEIREMT